MADHETDDAERGASHQTLIRLANSCERAAARRKSVSPLGADLNEEDYRDIAAILRTLAQNFGPDLGSSVATDRGLDGY